MADHRMQALEPRMSVKVLKKADARNPEGGCHILGVKRKPGEVVSDVPLSTAQALQAAGWVSIKGSPSPSKETAATK